MVGFASKALIQHHSRVGVLCCARSLYAIAIAVVLIVGGCVETLTSRLALPERNTLVRDQLVIHSDFTLATHHRLFEELTAQRTDLCRRLALSPSDEPIHIYLFESAERFDRFMRLHHPKFPDRRAFFVETDMRLSVYAQWGDRMAEDLRHEVTHAYLHSAVPDVPLWLDEGIAEYYETSRGQRGLNRSHLDRLLVRIRQEHWQPDLRRLEQFSPDESMSQDDYAESWAWVHFLLESQPSLPTPLPQRERGEMFGTSSPGPQWEKGVTLEQPHEILREYLADLRRYGDPAPLSMRLASLLPDPNAALLEHVKRLENGKW